MAIVPVHRADGSGTSFIFTDYLSSVNPAWADSVGKGSSVKWPAGIGLAAKGSEGVAGQVKQFPAASATRNSPMPTRIKSPMPT
jgi:phosphate transport system substrate-binding protein